MDIVIFTGLQLHLQACWKGGVLQPPSFTMPKSSVMPLELICKRRKAHLWRKCIFSPEMLFFPLAVIVNLKNVQVLLAGRWYFGSSLKTIWCILRPIRLWKLVSCNDITTGSLPYHIPLSAYKVHALYVLICSTSLRIPDTYEAKIAKICNFWTF